MEPAHQEWKRRVLARDIVLDEIGTERFKERFGGKSIQHSVAPATAAGATPGMKAEAAE
jgi:hypothetical protein